MDFVQALKLRVACDVQSDPDVLASFTHDQAPLAPAGMPVALVRARSVGDVVATLRFANERGIPVVPRAAGTGLAGGANAVDGCIVLSVLAMNRILEIDARQRIAIVEPGVLNATLAAEAVAQDLYYAPDPASRDISTIGGNIATNAGGSCCLKYGVTGDHVLALDVVLADGTLIQAGKAVRKNVAGFDLVRLMVGSEGTLGVIVKATMRLRPRPRSPSTLVSFFETMQAAAHAIVLMEKTTELSLIELMDRVTVRAVDDLTHMDLDRDAAAMLLIQSDAGDAQEAIARCEAIAVERGARGILRTDDTDEGRQLLAARRMALPALERLGTTLLDDVGVPKHRIPLLFEAIEQSAKRHELVIGTFGHAGDGNFHPTIVFDRRDPKSEKRAREAFDEIVHAALELGGTITGEHGVGSLKEPYLAAMIGESERALMKRIKAAFDPKGTLNPGKAI